MTNKLDLTGKKVGCWIVTQPIIGKNGKFNWVCRCECGTEIIRGSYYIKTCWKGTDCGCKRSLEGKKFGKLTILKRIGTNGKFESNYLCKCDCGQERTYRGKYILYRNLRSCGCQRKHNVIENGQKLVWWTYKKNAKKRNITFDLQFKNFVMLIEGPCGYCGNIATNTIWPYKKKTEDNQKYYCNGIDRIDNTEGYTEKNSISCCKFCNHMKWDMCLKNWLQHITKVLEFQKQTATAVIGG